VLVQMQKSAPSGAILDHRFVDAWWRGSVSEV
jgi:hypothetical protein